MKEKLQKELGKQIESNNIPKKTLQEQAKLWLIAFFIIMAVLTLLSRAADTITVARVETVQPQNGCLTFHFTGDGVFEAKTEKPIQTEKGLTVENVFVDVGQRVKQGDPLFTLHMQDIEDQLYAIKNSIEKLKIQVQQEALINQGIMVQEQDAAQIALDHAMADLQMVTEEQAYIVACAEWDLQIAQEKLEEKEVDLKNAAEKTIEDRVKEKQEAYNTAKLAYSNGQYEYDTAVKEAERVLQDAKKELSRLNNEDSMDRVNYAVNQYNQAASSGDPDKIQAASDYLDKVLHGENGIENHKDIVSDAETKVKRAAEDITAVREKWEMELSDKKEKLQKAEQELTEVKKGTYDFKQDIEAEKLAKEAAEEAVTAAERMVEAAYRTQEIEIQKAERIVSDAEIQLEQSVKQDNYQAANKEQEILKNSLSQQSLQLDIKEKEIAYNRFLELQKANGIVQAPVDGVIAAVAVETGKTTSSEAALRLSLHVEGYLFRGQMEKDAGDYIKPGDKMKISLKGRKQGIEVIVQSLAFLSGTEKYPDGMAEITADLPAETFIPGMSASFELDKRTESYRYCIPIRAIREDSNGKFILVLREWESVLGKKTVATRLDVQVLDQDSQNAAIEGMISKEDQVIINSNKAIGEGDRVRLAE